jgi:exodeoxyribonuclease VII large subunit
MARLQAVLEPAIDKSFWLRAEVGSANERDGILYCELVESRGGTVRAKMRCTIWPQELRRIRMSFQRLGLELALQHGSVVGMQCCVQFHAVHGLSLKVLDMDPAFALGELALKRQRILESLAQDDLLTRNAQRAVSLLPNRIVLVTSRSGAAYHDFMRTLQTRRGFGIRVWLADALMQGAGTEESVLAGLRVAECLPADLVVLIRGGGSKTDLSWLDSEPIARRIAGLQLPVWTGIGHETDESVLDAVAAQSFRTPTAVAEALVARFEQVAARLERDSVSLRQGSRKLLALRQAELAGDANKLRVRVTTRLGNAQAAWVARSHRLRQSMQTRLGVESGRVERQRSALQRCTTQRMTASNKRLAALSGELRTRVARRLSSSQLSLSPRATRLRGAVALRTGTAATRLDGTRKHLEKAASRMLQQAELRLRQTGQRLSQPRVLARCERERALLLERERVVRASDPKNALARGFSLTYTASGALLRSVGAAVKGEAIVTHVADGRIESTITQLDGEPAHERKDGLEDV